jgi:hypothetical protein
MGLDIAWYGCDWPSGRIITELPGLVPTGKLSRRLGGYATTSFSLDLSARTTDWIPATQQGRVLLVGVQNDRPLWAGTVQPRARGSAPTSTLSASTVEGYLDRRFTADLAITADLSDIAAALLAQLQATTPCLDISTIPTGIVATRGYYDADDKKVLANLGELMATSGGPEFIIDPQWAPDRLGFRMLARIAPRIGSQDPGPVAVFDYPGPVTEYEQAESYEDGKGATVVRATGAGEGATRAVSATLTSPHVADGWPVYEYRWSPGSDITDVAVLNSHALAALTLMQDGASSWSLTANAGEGPALGADWSLGDQVQLVVQAGTSEAHPDGATITARCWAWDLDTAAGTVTPIIVEAT